MLLVFPSFTNWLNQYKFTIRINFIYYWSCKLTTLVISEKNEQFKCFCDRFFIYKNSNKHRRDKHKGTINTERLFFFTKNVFFGWFSNENVVKIIMYGLKWNLKHKLNAGHMCTMLKQGTRPMKKWEYIAKSVNSQWFQLLWFHGAQSVCVI